VSSLQHLAADALARDPARPAVASGDVEYNWGDLARVAGEVRALLAAGGIAAGAPVAFVARNRPAALAALLAVVADGRTIRMIYAFQAAAGMVRDAVRLKPAALIADVEDFGVELCTALAAEGVAAISLDGMSARAVPGLERGNGAVALDPPQIEILTSGIIGSPKPFAVPYA
jgi:long-chain acyl-CoA synthetase